MVDLFSHILLNHKNWDKFLTVIQKPVQPSNFSIETFVNQINWKIFVFICLDFNLEAGLLANLIAPHLVAVVSSAIFKKIMQISRKPPFKISQF